MRFDKDTISITFQYEQVDAPTYLGMTPHKSRQTTCTIRRVEPKGKTEDGQIIGTGVAIRHVNDPDNKFLARRITMAQAMKQAFPDKTERALIWSEYLEKVRVP